VQWAVIFGGFEAIMPLAGLVVRQLVRCIQHLRPPEAGATVP
jgi:putative Mn2+ efflux pump MntP